MANQQTVGQRFSQLIQALGMSKNAFALSLDKTATVIQHIVEERNKPGFDLLCKVFEVYPNVSKDWLLQGSGDMFSFGQEQGPEPKMPKPIEEEKVLPAAVADTPLVAAEPPVAAVVAPPAPQPVVPAVASAPGAVAPEQPAPVPAAAPAAGPSWEVALYAQQLQHQLALAELRNQHLLEQQKMLQQMVELMRQAR
ncbi:hypothetical protein GCM10027048_38980 [Hymenobacter coalescens]